MAGAVAGGVVGFLIALFGEMAGATQSQITIIVQVFSALAGVLVGIIVVRSALRKKYSDFRIVLVSLAQVSASDT